MNNTHASRLRARAAASAPIVVVTLVPLGACKRAPSVPPEHAAYWARYGDAFTEKVLQEYSRCPGAAPVDRAELRATLLRTAQAAYYAAGVPECEGFGMSFSNLPCGWLNPESVGLWQVGLLDRDLNWTCAELARIVRGERPALVPIVDP